MTACYTASVSVDRELARRERARARRAEEMLVEPIHSLDEEVRLHERGESPLSLLRAATLLTRAAWLASGRELPPTGRAHRATMPGTLYELDESRRSA